MEIYEKVNIYFRICSGNLNTHNTSGFVHTIARSLGIGSAPKRCPFLNTAEKKVASFLKTRYYSLDFYKIKKQILGSRILWIDY